MYSSLGNHQIMETKISNDNQLKVFITNRESKCEMKGVKSLVDSTLSLT